MHARIPRQQLAGASEVTRTEQQCGLGWNRTRASHGPARGVSLPRISTGTRGRTARGGAGARGILIIRHLFQLVSEVAPRARTRGGAPGRDLGVYISVCIYM